MFDVVPTFSFPCILMSPFVSCRLKPGCSLWLFTAMSSIIVIAHFLSPRSHHHKRLGGGTPQTHSLAPLLQGFFISTKLLLLLSIQFAVELGDFPNPLECNGNNSSHHGILSSPSKFNYVNQIKILTLSFKSQFALQFTLSQLFYTI